jgi:hypothetical protein
MRNLDRDDEKRLRDQLAEEVRQNTPRSRRARRFADTVVHGLVWDFIATDRVCLERLTEHLMLMGFASNAEIVNVPPEWDALDKVALERAMLEAKAARVLPASS